MKTVVKIFTIVFLSLTISLINQKVVSAQQGYVSFQVFYDQLSPYGQWVNNQDYGYIWIPDVGSDFAPYSTEGHWVMTDYGWTWVSDYDWGWAPFHYGRWDYDNYYGWFWVPDNEWGPSWVTWRRGNGYYGWAPMRPGISVSMSFGGGYNDADRWNFVRDRDFDRRNLGRYYVNRRDNDFIIRSSTVINNTYVDNSRNVTYISGPRSNDIQIATGRRISSVAIRDNDRPGQRLSNNQLQLYRPKVERSNDSRQGPAPARIMDAKDVRPPAERNASNSRRNNVKQSQPVQSQQQQQMQRREQDPQQKKNIEVQQQQQQQQNVEQRQQQQKNAEQQQQQQKNVEQQQQNQKQQTDTRRQVQQQGQSVQQKDQQNQQVKSTPARTRRLERQQNKANNPEKIKKKDEGNKQN